MLLSVAGVAGALGAWKYAVLQEDQELASGQPEPIEVVRAAEATPREHRRTTTSIGTVLALRSITLQNELAGTVREVRLVPGEVVEAGALLVALDVGVEEAELAAQEARAELAETLLGRLVRARDNRGASEADVDRARAERDVARAEVGRIRAIIERKTLRAPFRARVGIADLHPGQYLNEGTAITTLQGVGEAVHVDFTVAQGVTGLVVGQTVDVFAAGDQRPLKASIVALDARVDPTTRNSLVRARIEGTATPAPGASVRVQVPVGPARESVTVPVSALRKGPAGDHVFVVEPDEAGHPRAHVRSVVSGVSLGDEVVIESGLAAGEQVAASGSFKLREAVLVALSDGDEGEAR